MSLRTSYRSFLLRLWRREGGPEGLHALLEDPVTGERVGFSSLQALMTYLEHVGEELAPPQEKGQSGVPPDETEADLFP